MMERVATMDQLVERMAAFERLRQTRPVAYDEQDESWHVFRYGDVLRVLTETSRFSAFQAVYPTPVRGAPSTRALSLFAEALTPRMVHGLVPQIVEQADELLQRIHPKSELDVIGDLAAPLSASVLGDLVGVSPADRPTFQTWTHALLIGKGLECQEPSREHAPVAASTNPPTFLSELLEQRRRDVGVDPQPDLSGAAVAAADDHDLSSVLQLAAGLRLFLEVAYTSMVHLLGNAVICLAAHPDVVEQMHRQPAPVYSTVEEALRYLPPIWAECHTTMTDVSFESVQIPAGARVYAWIVSANRDPSQFAQPDRFDIERIPNRHLTLRYGLYAQIAGALARIVTTTALPLLLRHGRVLRPAARPAPALVESATVFGVKRLPIGLQLSHGDASANRHHFRW